MSVIDIHSHILPGIDDGSRNIDTSLQILELVTANGVDGMIATPHFYADRNTVDKFLEKRERAYEEVMERRSANHPFILKGAEVAYFQGMSKADRISELTIEGTDILLLEMPFDTWDDAILKEVEDLIEKRKLRIILAHLERFMKLPGNKPYIEEILEMPVKVQINAESLQGFFAGRPIIKMFKNHQAHFLGSDCHGMHRRPPNLWEGRSILGQKLGQDFLADMDKELEDYLDLGSLMKGMER